MYEREAIERWFSTRRNQAGEVVSPRTNSPMGKELLDSLSTRKTIAALIEGGCVDDDSAAAWHLGSAKAMIFDTLPGNIGATKTHLSKAASTLEEAQLLLEAMELKSKMDGLFARSRKMTESDDDAVAVIFGGRYGNCPQTPMKTYRRLTPMKSIIRVIADVAELKRLCLCGNQSLRAAWSLAGQVDAFRRCSLDARRGGTMRKRLGPTLSQISHDAEYFGAPSSVVDFHTGLCERRAPGADDEPVSFALAMADFAGNEYVVLKCVYDKRAYLLQADPGRLGPIGYLIPFNACILVSL